MTPTRLGALTFALTLPLTLACPGPPAPAKDTTADAGDAGKTKKRKKKKKKKKKKARAPEPGPEDEVTLIPDDELEPIGAIAAAILRGETVPEVQLVESLGTEREEVFVQLRDNGRLVAAGHGEGASLRARIEQAMQSATADLSPAEAKKINGLVFDLAYGIRSGSVATQRKNVTRKRRGIRGMRLSHGSETRTVTPTEMLALNGSFEKEFASFRATLKLDQETFDEEAQIDWFAAQQVLVKIDPDGKVRSLPMYRGNTVVHQEEVTKERTAQLIDDMMAWMTHHLRDDGRMTYMWFPTTSAESNSNNMIRQWMATLCFVRMSNFKNDPKLVALADKNIRYNLEHFYREEDGFGLIEFRNTAKLGAIALAALSLMEHQHRAKYTRQIKMLLKTMDDLWEEDGKHTTHFKPRRDGAENFFPGEAMLTWGQVYKEDPNQELLDRFMKSVWYYKEYHLGARKAAFIPWHTRAHYRVWSVTRDEELRDWTYRMNDWLLGIQQGKYLYDDTPGRFYDPRRAIQGKPNASSTGVYLEGLSDAYSMAKEDGDAKHTDAYRDSMARALRWVIQVQFLDEIDSYYVTDPEAVFGGLRTSVWNNEMRQDNTQHTLTGVMKIYERFEPEDYVVK